MTKSLDIFTLFHSNFQSQMRVCKFSSRFFSTCLINSSILFYFLSNFFFFSELRFDRSFCKTRKKNKFTHDRCADKAKKSGEYVRPTEFHVKRVRNCLNAFNWPFIVHSRFASCCFVLCKQSSRIAFSHG